MNTEINSFVDGHCIRNMLQCRFRLFSCIIKCCITSKCYSEGILKDKPDRITLTGYYLIEINN